MDKNRVMLITGTRKGIGKYLVEYYIKKGLEVIGCSREPVDYKFKNYKHFCLDVSDEVKAKKIFAEIRKVYKHLDVLINNAGAASLNHLLLTPVQTVEKLLKTNFIGTFLFCREAAKLMQRNHYGRIVNFTTVAVPLKLEGEAVYASAKAGIITLTQIAARELAQYGITVNAVGPTLTETDLIRSVPKDKIDIILKRQAVSRFGEFRDISNTIDFFISPASAFITGQVIFLGGI